MASNSTGTIGSDVSKGFATPKDVASYAGMASDAWPAQSSLQQAGSLPAQQAKSGGELQWGGGDGSQWPL